MKDFWRFPFYWWRIPEESSRSNSPLVLGASSSTLDPHGGLLQAAEKSRRTDLSFDRVSLISSITEEGKWRRTRGDGGSLISQLIRNISSWGGWSQIMNTNSELSLDHNVRVDVDESVQNVTVSNFNTFLNQYHQQNIDFWIIFSKFTDKCILIIYKSQICSLKMDRAGVGKRFDL